MVDGLISESSQESGLLDTVGLLKALASPTAPSILPLTLSPNSDLSPVVGCKYLHMSHLVSFRASQRKAMLSQVYRCKYIGVFPSQMSVTQCSMSRMAELFISQLENGVSVIPGLTVGCDFVMTV